MKQIPFYKSISVAACLVYVLTAYFSSGYYHADEQYQIIEFAGHVLGTHTPSDLAWEFAFRLRPSLQPLMAAGVIKACSLAGLYDVYWVAFILRLVSALFALFVIHRFIRATLHLVMPRNHTLYALLSYLLWFLPFINVRFASETWSALLFMLALSFLLAPGSRKHFLTIGICLGFSFVFRFQSAFMSAGLLLWMLFIQRTRWRDLLLTAAGGLLIVAFGMLCDYGFYGEFTCSFWNYFRVNILENGASDFGVSPWTYYMQVVLRMGLPLCGMFMLAALLTILLRKPSFVLLWVILPFSILHSYIPHKEERFLFPLAILFPLLMIVALQEWQQMALSLRPRLQRITNGTAKVLLALLLLVNFTGMAAMMVKPAGLGRMAVTEYIYRRYPGPGLHLVYCSWSNPYNPWTLETRFYHNSHIHTTEIKVLQELDTLWQSTLPVQLLVARKKDVAYQNGAQALQRNGYTKKMQSIPGWILYLNRFFGFFDEGECLELYEKQPVR